MTTQITALPIAPLAILDTQPLVSSDAPDDLDRQVPITAGEMLAAAYRDDPAGFLAHFNAWKPRTQAWVSLHVAAWLGVDVGDVDELWVETGLRLTGNHAG